MDFYNKIDFFLEKGLRVMYMGIKVMSEEEVKNFMEELKLLES